MKLFDEYQKLINNVSHPRGVFSFDKDNTSNFGDYIFRSDNVYWGFDTAIINNCAYIFGGSQSKDSVDLTRCDKCERCYECVDCYKCFDTVYSDGCDRSMECYFCSRCKDCQNCFCCVLLQNKQYCILNRQYTKEEYERKIKELLQKSLQDNLKTLRELALNYPIIYKRQSLDSSNVNVPYGNYIYKSVNSYYVFDCSNLTECGYIYDSDFLKNCWDIGGRSVNSVDCYECIDIGDCNNCFYCNNCSKCADCMHCYWCKNCQDCIGCVLLSDKKYCVLNRQLDKETYEKVKQLIKQDINADLSQYIKPARTTVTGPLAQAYYEA